MSGTLLDLAKLQIEDRRRESDEHAQGTVARKRHANTSKPASFLRRLTRTTPKAA